MFNDVFGMIGLNEYDWWKKYGIHAFLVVTWIIVLYKINKHIPFLSKFNR